MKRSNLIILCLLGIVATAVIALPACDSKPPVAPGTITNSQPCVTLGNNTVGLSTTTAMDLFLYPVVPSSSATLYTLSVYTASTGAVTFEAGIYSDNTNKPGSLLAETGPQTLSAPATLWNTAALKSYINLSGGVTYWLAYEASPANSVPDNSAVIAYCYQPQGAFGALASSFTGTVSTGYTFSVYGTTCP